MDFTKASGCMTLARDITMLSVIMKAQVKYVSTYEYQYHILTFFYSVLDCNDKIKPKDCVVETYLVGTNDAPGGTCPRGTHKWNGQHGRRVEARKTYCPPGILHTSSLPVVFYLPGFRAIIFD